MDELSSTNLSHKDLPEYTASVWVWMICSPILIGVGTFGNILSIVVLSRKSMRQSSLCIYLTILATSDLIVLYTGLLRQWIIIISEVDVRDFNIIMCKVHAFLVYVSLQYSAWILVIVTMERCVSIWFPYRRNLFCTRNGRLVASGATVTILMILNSHFFYGYGEMTDKNNKILKCTPIFVDYKYFIDNIWPWIDLCMFCLLPFSVLIFGNLAIILKTFRTKKALNQFSEHASASSPRKTNKEEQTSSITKTLLVLNLVFFITTSPISVYLIGESSWLTDDPHVMAKDLLAWACVNILQYSNNAMNFFMYCLSGSKFRRELFVMFRLSKPKRGFSTYYSPTHRRTSMAEGQRHSNSLSSISGTTVADSIL